MNSINSLRKNIRVGGSKDGKFVLYWMQISRRLHYNFSLEYAVAQANRHHLPLVILEGLAVDYPWATARTTTFILEGMAEHVKQLKNNKSVTYIPYPEHAPGDYARLVRDLCKDAALLVSDEFPVFIMRERNRQLEEELDIPFHTIDSNGIIPMALSEKAPYSAFTFRRLMQKKFLECWNHPPLPYPLKGMKEFGAPDLPQNIRDQQHSGMVNLTSDDSISDFVKQLPGLDHNVSPLEIKGTREAALSRLSDFIDHDLLRYDDDRNDPDKERTSRLSPWLHPGKISAFEVVDGVLSMQPKEWRVDQVRPSGGKRSGFFGGHSSIESFLDEVITWRETGFHFAWHTDDYDQYHSLPNWALETLAEHSEDPREWIYTYDEFACAKTHDPVWNAAQTQLREEGRIHNYLRMLWGKKILEWTPDPQTALKYMIDLNNTYAIDGRDPNSYSGIFWVLGRFDRAWGPERPIFGKIRYMTSKSARKKIKMEAYLKRYSGLGMSYSIT